MKTSNLILTILGFFILLGGCCDRYPEEVRKSLIMAGSNRTELEKVLKHYRQDSLGLESAFFLIGNMKWHYSLNVVSFHEEKYRKRTEWIDSLFSLWVGRVPDAVLYSNDMSVWLKKQKTELKDTFYLPEQEGDGVLQSDLKWMDSDFLISHIDNALHQWRKSPFASKLGFEDFCEYLLPYRCMPTEEGIAMDGGKLNRIYGKYLEDTYPFQIRNFVNRYLKITEILRNYHDSLPEGKTAGMYRMFYKKGRDCVEDCVDEVNVLRSCGVPVALDFNIGNREFVGQHHHCVFIEDSTGEMQPFSAAMKYPAGSSWGYAANLKLNIYRLTFGAQADSPYYLKAEGEFLPEEFRGPCLKDVTSYIKPVDTIRLPFPYHTENKLAWLYTYARNREGMRAVTWGKIDTLRKEVVFPHVVRNMLYFPVHFDGKTPVFGKEAFYTVLQNNNLRIIPFHDSILTVPEKVFLTRKFPYKPGALKNVKEMVGAKVYGSDSPGFEKKELLFTLKEVPGICFQDYMINTARKPYRYYRWEAAGNQTYIGELEWLTFPEYGYENVTEPSSLPVFAPLQGNIQKQRKFVRLLEKDKTEMEKIAEYDGNEETGGYSGKVTLSLEYPQMITCIRMVPRNAANGVIPGDSYELMYWENGWKSMGTKMAVYNYLEYTDLRADQLYWLRNLSRGKEEVPFTMQREKQCFIYYDKKLE